MSSLPIAQWKASLDQMEASLTNVIKSLDRAEERWERATAPSAGEGEMPIALERLDTRLQEWETRLQAAESLTDSVEKELMGRIAAAEQWRTLFAKWEKLIKREKSASLLS